MPCRRCILARLARVTMAVALVAALVVPSVFALDATTATPTAIGQDDRVEVGLGPATVSLDASANAVPVSGTFRFGARIAADRPIEYLQARLRLLTPGGDLIYQKTFVGNLEKRGAVGYTFERTLRDIGLDPGLYPVELAVSISADGQVHQQTLGSTLVVYDAEQGRLPLAIVARIAAQPLSDAEGRFTQDPAQYTRARDDARRLAEFVLADPEARFALALMPSMVEEWRQIAGGYRFEGAEGEVVTTAEDAVPRAYAETLDALARSAATGRLEILSGGYSDPDPSELARAGLTEDLATQLALGNQAVARALETTPSAGIAPAGGALPETSLPSLARAGVTYLVVDSHRVRRGGKQVEPGRYRSRAASVTVLAADAELARTVEQSAAADVRIQTYARLASAPEAPCATVFDLGPGALDSESFVAAVEQFEDQPWVRVISPSAAAATGARPRVALRAHRADPDAPEDYWTTVSDARAWASALEYALGESDADAARAVHNSLLAQSSVWAGFDGGWAPAGKGLAYAAQAIRSGNAVFGKIGLSAKTVTLAGNTGRIPVTVDNGTDERLRVVLTALPGPALEVTDPSRQVVVLEPGENVFEIPVELSNAISSEITIELSAAGTRFAETTASVRASYLDRIVLVIGVLAVLAALLVYIIRRVRSAEEDVEEQDGPAADPAE